MDFFILFNYTIRVHDIFFGNKFFSWHYNGKRWRAPNIEWAEWLKKSQNTKKIDDTPVIKNNSNLNLCLNNWPQKIKRSGQYQFKSSQEASIFCSRHREAVVLQLRMSVGRDSGESRL